ncbi:hypothetical protein MJ1_0739 [Nanobdella aerobiophila]|uniref:Uncharacterized protein n=1 Tax=Nanobdella aerobiophila TaxID=2586965 RepID=A0A915WS18_9ARCH|nr:hypothetical protein [Nanobdella aerobiophila]BBL45879.1 hypothetical protein MJ1_0739 [Nanobdella aerobiophila]
MSDLVEDLEYNRKLKEVLHIYNVSLKNNKGLETIRNFIKSAVDYYDYVIELFLEREYKNNKINEIPKTPIERYNLFLHLINDKDIENTMIYYKKLRTCLNSHITIQNEYRKTMIIVCKGYETENKLTIKDIKDIIENIRKFSNLIVKYI